MLLLTTLLTLLSALPHISSTAAAAAAGRVGNREEHARTPSILRPLPSSTIYQFDANGTWLENIAVRPNGDLLVTMLSPTASLYTLKRPYLYSTGSGNSGGGELSLIHTFENATGLLGITELGHDTYAVIALGGDDGTSAVPSNVWLVTPPPHHLPGASSSSSSWNVKKIATLPASVTVPNGIAHVPGSSAVLVGDSISGTITRCESDNSNSSCSTVLSGPELEPVARDDARHIGVNGVRYHAGYVYWSNSALVSVFRRKVDAKGFPVAGSGSLLVGKVEGGDVDVRFIDDFTRDKKGRLWMATYSSNAIVVLDTRDGKSEVVLGSASASASASDIGGPTATAFGRTVRDAHVLYVVTSGDSGEEPARIVAVHTDGY
ncbi:hypothetical protein F5Y17DRAFT_155355 [Xylariaceae sp. FL0594]|nr:hypothetical protein F5Y17DRAFT_155355 [Xylariaceae sp. FL0594]